MNLSEKAADSGPELRLEEAWILWKLNRKKEARDIGKQLLEEFPDRPDVMEFTVLSLMDGNDLDSAEKFLERLEEIDPESVSAKSLRADLLIRQKKWSKALVAQAALTAQDPGNMDYQAGYAQVLYHLQRWNEARELYEALKNDPGKRKDFVWVYRALLEEYGQGVSAHGRYLQAPGGLWEYQVREKVTFYPLKTLRTEIEVFHESFRQKSTGAESIRQSPIGHRLQAEWSFDENIKAGGYGESSYVGTKNANEFGVYLKAHVLGTYNQIEAGFNKIMRSPVEALNKRVRENDIKLTNEILFAERIKLSHVFGSSWYTIKPGQNEVTDDEDLGYIISSTSTADFIILTDPFFSLNVMYKYAHWEEGFDRAQDALGLFPEERLYSAGLYFEHQFADIINIVGSINRNYDHKREAYSTYSVFRIDLWFTDNARTSFMFENQAGDSGLNGGGNSQTARAGVDVYF